MATITPQAARTLPVLDPRTLGRPVHLLGRCAERLQKELIEQFQAPLNRRYRSQFEISEVVFHMNGTPADAQHRWLSFSADGGRVAFAADRNVLLCILAYRYGVQTTTSAAPAPEAEGEPETATEERLASRLGRQLASIIAGTIEALQPDAAPAHLAKPIEFADSALAPVDSGWTLRVKIAERAHQLAGTVSFRLDDRWIARLLRGLAPTRDAGKTQKREANTQPLTSRLQLTLAARLLEKEIALGTFLDLNVGDVIPIMLAGTDVLIGDSRLFTASVAEHKGKLCLTSFQDVE
jgi:flagellar motor switch protein FliM